MILHHPNCKQYGKKPEDCNCWRVAITTVERVMELANEGRSVVNVRQHPIKPIPAAWVQNYQARGLWQMVRQGCLVEYPKKGV